MAEAISFTVVVPSHHRQVPAFAGAMESIAESPAPGHVITKFVVMQAPSFEPVKLAVAISHGFTAMAKPAAIGRLGRGRQG